MKLDLHFGVGAPPILVDFSGDWDVHWGCDLNFDPWPYIYFTYVSTVSLVCSTDSHCVCCCNSTAFVPGRNVKQNLNI